MIKRRRAGDVEMSERNGSWVVVLTLSRKSEHQVCVALNVYMQRKALSDQISDVLQRKVVLHCNKQSTAIESGYYGKILPWYDVNMSQ